MTEPENFDDELFADLYNDDEPGNKAAAASVSHQAQVVQHSAETNQENPGDGSYDDEYDGDMNMKEEEYDEDDDDVDFNLGNGPSTDVSPEEEKPVTASYSAPQPPPPPSKGPNAKEDG